MYIIRNATVNDKQAIIDLARVFFDEGLEKLGFHFDEKKASGDFDALVGTAGVFGLLIEKESVGVVGMICGAVSGKIFCSGLSLQELAWFVHPDHRSCGVRLLRAFEERAKDYGCSDILMASTAGLDMDSFYSRMGYRKTQSFFYKEV